VDAYQILQFFKSTQVGKGVRLLVTPKIDRSKLGEAANAVRNPTRKVKECDTFQLGAHANIWSDGILVTFASDKLFAFQEEFGEGRCALAN
jgi:hypothetical protein